MLLALLIAGLAVFLGLGLGLLPAVSRRALGPLRTLALTAVVAVVVLHLLPEALSELGGLGLCVFAAALALPSWLSRLPRAHGGHGSFAQFGFELGFWGLVLHHVGDGLALGAYSRVDERTGRPHLDVLLALVLHTVPLVAVVAATYARLRGVRVAVARCTLLALAMVVGLVGARAVSPVFAGTAQAWVAAGVSGLLLHGMTHELTADPPLDTASRSLDLAMGILGALLGWAGAELDHHPELGVGIPVETMLSMTFERAALPLIVGLFFGVVLSGRKTGSLSEYSKATRADRGGVLSPEAFFISLVHFGWPFALVRDGISALFSLFRRQPAEAQPSHEKPRPFFERLGERVDVSVGWALIGALVAAVIRASLPEKALLGQFWIGFPIALLISLTVPMHALLALQVSFALVDRGLPLASAVLIALLPPVVGEASLWRRPWLLAFPLLVAYLASEALLDASLSVPRGLGQAALCLALALALGRAYKIGLRAWISNLITPRDEALLPELDSEGQRHERSLTREQRPERPDTSA